MQTLRANRFAVASTATVRRQRVVAAARNPLTAALDTTAKLKLPAQNGVFLRQLVDDASSTYSYLVADPVTRDAVLIDPVLEQVERDLGIIDDLSLNLVQCVNTHCHADHITGSGKIKSLHPSVKSAIAAASGAQGDVFLQDGDVISIGGLHLFCLATPGHTNGCISYYLPSPVRGTAGMVFTGDTLLIRACGRTDFQQGNAGGLYDVIHAKIFSLPDDTIVYPGHDYKGRMSSSVGEEKALNPRLTKSREEFIEIMDNLGLPYPKQIEQALPANLKDGLLPVAA